MTRGILAKSCIFLVSAVTVFEVYNAAGGETFFSSKLTPASHTAFAAGMGLLTVYWMIDDAVDQIKEVLARIVEKIGEN